ncbi:GAF domain-containing protein [Paenibacillus macerans]|uniref:GAF domain-containing protein n=1 Tax=Paenibacillus TaxID=44249 RepID=UPI000EBF4423|nr:GAF domain-containing protein [Paenibacillus macerans]MEC0138687.1 GAF domain-containing protein [Paenibacillus macerans]MED4957447.1 GAF domain-containing protein [Paenibacillus macerans]GBK61552.1 control of nitrate reduction [Paenibacillus macerans]GBK67855.1 control of nitrate reduction [Paenibacillus macerans]
MKPLSSDYQFKIDQLREQAGYDFAALAFAQTAVNDYVITWQFASGNLNERYKRIVLQSGKGIAGIVFKTGIPILVTSVREQLNPKELINYPIVMSEKLTGLAAIPLYLADRVEGVLLIGCRGGQTMPQDTLQALYGALHGRFGDFAVKELTIP